MGNKLKFYSRILLYFDKFEVEGNPAGQLLTIDYNWCWLLAFDVSLSLGMKRVSSSLGVGTILDFDQISSQCSVFLPQKSSIPLPRFPWKILCHSWVPAKNREFWLKVDWTAFQLLISTEYFSSCLFSVWDVHNYLMMTMVMMKMTMMMANWWWWWWQSNFSERGCPAAALRVWPWASNERTPIGNSRHHH